MAVDGRRLGHTVATLTGLGPRCCPGAHRQPLWAEVRAGRVLSRQEYPVGLTTSVAWILPPPHSVLGHRRPVWF